VFRSHIVKNQVDGTTILLDMKTNEYYALNETASELLELIEKGLSWDQACEVLAKRYEVELVQLTQDMNNLMQELKEKGWIE
jgi:rRNA processing protein Krr1/Pno1